MSEQENHDTPVLGNIDDEDFIIDNVEKVIEIGNHSNSDALKELKERTEIKKLEEEIQTLKQDRFQRKQFAYFIFGFASVYMICVFTILFLKGFLQEDFALSDLVTNILLGTTTANVLGVLIIVVTYFFHKEKQK